MWLIADVPAMIDRTGFDGQGPGCVRARQIPYLHLTQKHQNRRFEPISVVNEARYVQHNPRTDEVSEGLATLFWRFSEGSPQVNITRTFEDRAFVFAHTGYDL